MNQTPGRDMVHASVLVLMRVPMLMLVLLLSSDIALVCSRCLASLVLAIPQIKYKRAQC